MFYAYILRSEKDGTFYYGSAKDVRKRVRDYNAGLVRYTRGHCPYVLHYSEGHPTRSEAVRRELFFKALERWPNGFPKGLLRRKALVSINHVFVYVLRGLKDGTHYYGSASDVQKRLREHNAGKGKFTKGHRPYELIYSEKLSTKSEALAREKFFKSIDGYNWLRSNGVIPK